MLESSGSMRYSSGPEGTHLYLRPVRRVVRSGGTVRVANPRGSLPPLLCIAISVIAYLTAGADW